MRDPYKNLSDTRKLVQSPSFDLNKIFLGGLTNTLNFPKYTNIIFLDNRRLEKVMKESITIEKVMKESITREPLRR